jgi:Mor family transcriptional regulator
MSVTEGEPVKSPEFLEYIAANLAALLTDEGLSVERARSIARRHVDKMRRDWRGAKVYIPMGRYLDKSERDVEIARRWNGRNTRELCREFGISEVHLRRIAASAHP